MPQPAPLERLRKSLPPASGNNELTDERRQEARRHRHKLKREVRRIVRTTTAWGGRPKFRVAWCGHRIQRDDWGDERVSVMCEDGRAWYRGLYRCGDVWLCPDCASKIAAGRKLELGRAVTEASHQGLSGALITYTFPHTRMDGLDAMLKQFARARAKLRSCRAWKRFVARWRIAGEVKGLEVTHGENGWHPHAHTLTFFEGKIPESQRVVFEDELFEMWRHQCLRADLPAPSREHGIHVRWFDDAANLAADYVAKWSSIQELTGAASKEGRKMGRNPWRLLEDAAAGDQRAAKLWLEYATVFHGRQQLRWSKGLRNRLKEKVLLDDEFLEEGHDREQELLKLSREQWLVLCRSGAQDWVLEVAELEGREAVHGAVNSILHNVPLPGGKLTAQLE
jgi:hypothetical protein